MSRDSTVWLLEQQHFLNTSDKNYDREIPSKNRGNCPRAGYPMIQSPFPSDLAG